MNNIINVTGSEWRKCIRILRARALYAFDRGKAHWNTVRICRWVEQDMRRKETRNVTLGVVGYVFFMCVQM